MARVDKRQPQLARFSEILALDTVLFDAMVRMQRLSMDREADQLQKIRERLAAPMSAVQSAAYEAMQKERSAKHLGSDR